MKTRTLKITCQANTEAIILTEVIEEYNDAALIDERQSNMLFISIEGAIEDGAFISEEDMKEELGKAIEDAVMTYEFPTEPTIEVIDHDFNDEEEESDEYRPCTGDC